MMNRVLKDLACDAKELSILFTDDGHITALNREYRGKDRPTNVLAFPMAGGASDLESGMLGDIVISVDTALRESAETGEAPEWTIYRLLIHGLLHLLGHDHHDPAGARRMRAAQRRILKGVL